VLLAALAVTTGAAGSARAVKAPTGLRAFVYRADEPVKADHTYALMPAFAWNSVTGASDYELQLASSRTFADATLLNDGNYQAPVASIQSQVPWMTGHPYALWVRVRVVAHGRTSPWSKPFGFNTAWQTVPQQEAAPDGLLRWSTIQGATSYDVWVMNVPDGTAGRLGLHFTTLTNVADERDFWTFHPQLARGAVLWRVRANRLVTAGSLPNGIPVVTHGPYSAVFSTRASGTISAGRIRPVAAESDAISPAGSPHAHQLTPGFAWTGSQDVLGDVSSLWRVYVFSDKGCVNPVLTGSVVGSPAWAPRDVAPTQLPGDTDALAKTVSGLWPGFGAQAGTFAADGEPTVASESTTLGGAASTASSGDGSGGSSSTTVQAALAISLPDNGWPQGRYWWTVVPVGILEIAPSSSGPSSSSSSSASATLEYHDMALPQDLCAAGQVWPFGMQSAPVTTTSATPYASGLLGARVVSAATRTPQFQLQPVITWKPALAASTYEIEVSRRSYPWNAVIKQTSVVPSAVLPLSKHSLGVWYYRVRGVNPNLLGPAQKLAWSKPVAIRISGDRFHVVR
jgi:hypothetical protein